MGDILSQDEINALINALNTGELDVNQIQASTTEKRVKLHNFRRPSKFAKDHLRTLTIINETYARLITTFLTGYLRTLVQIEVLSVETLQYMDFNNSLPVPTMLGIVDLSPLEGSIIFELGPNISFAMVDRILGGKGTGLEKIRNFSEIEIAILERVLIQILNLMKEPWENVVSIRPRLERIETNSQFAQIISPNEMVALVTLSAKIGEVEGFMNICIPHLVLEPVISKLSTKLWYTTVEKEISQELKNVIERKIQNTKVPVSAVLGKSVITVQDFLGLQKGDVIPLNTSVSGDMDIMVGNILKFHAKPGVKKNKVAVKITDIVRGEDE